MNILNNNMRTAIVIEDDKDLLDAYSDDLKIYGFDPVPVKNAGQLDSILNSTSQYELAIVDHKLWYGIRGADVAKKIKDHHICRRIIIVSAFTDEVDSDELNRLGIPVEPKPSTLKNILKKVYGTSPAIFSEPQNHKGNLSNEVINTEIISGARRGENFLRYNSLFSLAVFLLMVYLFLRAICSLTIGCKQILIFIFTIPLGIIAFIGMSAIKIKTFREVVISFWTNFFKTFDRGNKKHGSDDNKENN